MSAFMIRTEHLSHTYKDETGNLVYAVKDVSLTVAPGEFVAVIGTNGSGKSTLAKHFNALLLPTEGVCEVAGMRTDIRENVWNIRQHVGMVFQNPDNQIVSSIVEDEVAFGPENLGVGNPELRTRVEDALKAVGMYEYRKRETHKLSGGQKQRIAIAGAVAMRPDCIVFDEPTAMLDPEGRKQVMKAIRSLNEQGITIILITHFMEEVAEAERVLVMKSGKLLADEAPEEIFADKELVVEAGLEIPAVVLVRDRLRECGVALSSDIISKDDLVEALCQ